MDAPSFVSGASTPHEIRVLPGLLSRIDKPSSRAVMSWALRYFKLTSSDDSIEDLQAAYQQLVSEMLEKDRQGVFAEAAAKAMPIRRKKARPLVEEDVSTLCAGVFLMLRSAIRTRIDPKQIVPELTEMKYPETFIADFGSLLTKNASLLRKIAQESDVSLPTLKNFDWRVDVTISSSSMMKVLRPSVTTKMELSDGRIETCEMSIEKFQQLRYSVAKALRDVEETEKLPILRIDDRLERARSVRR